MATNFSFHKLFTELRQTKNNFKRISILKENDTPQVRAFFVLAYHPNIKWLLPTGVPPYKPNENFMEERGYFNLVKNLHQFNMFIAGRGYDNMKQINRESKFINILESVTPIEAEYIVMAKDRNIKGVTLKTVNAAFSNLIPTDED